MIECEVVAMFTSGGPLSGSPLGVVPAADTLSTTTMAKVARELRCAETAFVLPPEHPAATYRVRVFTPERESPHGGHSCVGTAATLVRLGVVPVGRVIQECGNRLQELTATAESATLVTREQITVSDIDGATLTAAAGVARADLAVMPSRRAGFGSAFAFLPMRTEAAVDSACPDFDCMARSGLPALSVFSWNPGQRTAYARLFAPGFDIPEDPACAPIAMSLGGWLVDAGLLTGNGVHEYTIHQGTSVRRGRLRCTVTVADRLAVAASVTGQVVRTEHRDLGLTTA
jgi:trans-2,3-dihydro-3-hydroxyanthranilate isomerase